MQVLQLLCVPEWPGAVAFELLRTTTHHKAYMHCNPGKCITRCVASFRLKGDPAKFEPAQIHNSSFNPLTMWEFLFLLRSASGAYRVQVHGPLWKRWPELWVGWRGVNLVRHTSSYFLRAWNYFWALDSILIPLQQCSGCCSLPFQRIADSAQQGSRCFQARLPNLTRLEMLILLDLEAMDSILQNLRRKYRPLCILCMDLVPMAWLFDSLIGHDWSHFCRFVCQVDTADPCDSALSLS